MSPLRLYASSFGALRHYVTPKVLVKSLPDLKDPLRPKRPPPINKLYANALYANLTDALAPVSHSHLSDQLRDASRLWKSLSAEEKQPFIDQHRELCAEYRQQLDQYLSTRARRTEPKHQQPPTSWTIFAREQKVPFKEGSKLWKALSEDEKKSYANLANQQYETYKVRMLELECNLAPGTLYVADATDKLKAARKKASLIRLAASNRDVEDKPRRPTSAFVRFLNDRGLSSRDGSSVWKSLPEEEKKIYLDPATHAFSEWSKKYAAFVDKLIKSDTLDVYNARCLLKKQRGVRRPTKLPTGRAKAVFSYFFQDFSKRLPPSPRGDGCSIAKAAAAKWKTMTDEEKAPYYAAREKDFKERNGSPPP
ncbi:hypothetical protein BXZ70DRAFT_1005897 [Cristinia sonorae]|uniref:HMG box domain-containing protein n=1 Tax=Cristinia sonorae TaxID=1940300 RepID=A0A8K0XS67_9AGAR|nr:hypothetical protein BXZ70DRAFT_1005897 [Cristinia sonorae]